MKRPPITVDIDGEDTPALEPLAPVIGSFPLANPKHEKFVQSVYVGTPQSHAYRDHVATKRTVPNSTAESESSRLMKRPEVIARYKYLVDSRKEVDGDAAPDDVSTDPASRREVIIQATRIIRGRNPAIIKLRAMDRLTKINQWDKTPPEDPTKKAPDPAFFAAYIQRLRSTLVRSSPQTGATEASPPA